MQYLKVFKLMFCISWSKTKDGSLWPRRPLRPCLQTQRQSEWRESLLQLSQSKSQSLWHIEHLLVSGAGGGNNSCIFITHQALWTPKDRETLSHNNVQSRRECFPFIVPLTHLQPEGGELISRDSLNGWRENLCAYGSQWPHWAQSGTLHNQNWPTLSICLHHPQQTSFQEERDSPLSYLMHTKYVLKGKLDPGRSNMVLIIEMVWKLFLN